MAYVSYNAMPGWGPRGSLRQALLELVREGDDEVSRLALARKGLAHLRQVSPLEGTAEGALIQQEIEALAEKPDMYLLHEYLVEEASAFTVREFTGLAAKHGLAYLDDVAPLGVGADAERQSRDSIAALGLPRLGAEQVLDLMTFRQFRATLLVRDDVEVAASPRPELQPGDSPTVPIPARPRVSALTRMEVEIGRYASTPEHAVAAVDPFHAALIELLDGQCNAAELSEKMVEAVASGRLSAQGPTQDPPAIQQVRRAMPNLVADAIRRLAGAGLLETD